MEIKLSLASAIYLNLKPGKLNFPVSTIYIMLGEKCSSNCLFCAQARSHIQDNMLSRVPWYHYDPEIVIERLKSFRMSRICIQTLDYPDIEDDLLSFLKMLKDVKVPVSVSITPVSKDYMLKLKDYVDTISIALDAATEPLFDKFKGKAVGNRFAWNKHWKALITAKKIFKNVNTHLIVGLGESDRKLIELMLILKKENISIALFAYTPVNHALELQPPALNRYRKVQMARYIIENYDATMQNFEFENDALANINFPGIDGIIEDGMAFMTSGCRGCNRPYYNEKPGGNLYNVPYHPTPEQINSIKKELKQ